MHSMRVLAGVAILALLVPAVGCNRRPANDDVQVEPSGGGEGAASGPPAGWPRVLVIGPGTGPGLFVGADGNAPAFGYVNPGVRIRLEAGPQNGRVQALLAGPLPAKAWIPADRVAAYAHERGRVEGTPFYLGPNDFVTVLGPAGEGRMRVAVRPWLGGGTFLEAQTGTFQADKLGDQRVDPANAEGPTAGQCFVLPSGQTQVYDRPGGRVVATLPAQDTPATVVVLRERAPWYGIRAGYGPYVVGYVQGQLTACSGARPEPAPMVPPSSGEMPYWMSQEQGTLHRVAAGTRVRFGNRTVARLRQDGWARELGREQGDMVDVFVAVDNGVALRGLVPASALTPLEGGSQPAQQPSRPSQPLPDELAD